MVRAVRQTLDVDDPRRGDLALRRLPQDFRQPNPQHGNIAFV